MGKYLRKFSAHSEYESGRQNLVLPNVSLCAQENDVHYNPYVDPCKSTIISTTYDMIDLGLPSGLKWANKNIGASDETDYGQYFAWGEVSGYTAEQVSGECKSKAFSWNDYELTTNSGSTPADMTKYNPTDKLTTLELEDDAAHVNMGGNWRMPTQTEFEELFNNTDDSWEENYNGTGINGWLFTADNGNTLFFPADGLCSGGSVDFRGEYGYYWSSSRFKSVATGGMNLRFDSSNEISMNIQTRCYGFAVRGVVAQ